MIDTQTDCKLLLISWDMYGLESVVDVTQKQKDLLFDILATDKNQFDSWLIYTINHMILRAQANSHRNYEIYSIRVSEEIEVDELAEMFKENPQNMADLIRERGNSLYNARRGHRDQVIF